MHLGLHFKVVTAYEDHLYSGVPKTEWRESSNLFLPYVLFYLPFSFQNTQYQIDIGHSAKIVPLL